MKRFTTFSKILAGIVLAFFSVTPITGMASEGHDHGEGAVAAAGAASPRFTAHSDLFEILGIVDKGQMVVYLDRYASNEPVIGARVEFEAGTGKGIAAPQADGTYLIKFDALGKPGNTPFSFTVTAGTDTDLLAGDLSISDDHAHAATGKPWLRWLAYGLVVVALLAGAVFTFRRLREKRMSAKRMSFN